MLTDVPDVVRHLITASDTNFTAAFYLVCFNPLTPIVAI